MKTHAPLALALASFTLSSTLLAQGPLTPPGAPGPTMKTLQQIEPRTDLQATPAPAGVDTMSANYQYRITQPGSYYLSANLGVTKPNGIHILVEGVTLDLNGFRISRASGTGGNGIEIWPAAHGAAARNGSITGFAYGIHSEIIGVNVVDGSAFRDLAVSFCTHTGILAGNSAVLENCRVFNNSGSHGISAGAGSILSHCAVVIVQEIQAFSPTKAACSVAV